MSDATQDDRLVRLFAEAVELPEAERAAFLDRACHGDLALADELRRLLSADAGEDHLGRMTPGATSDTLQPGARIGPYVLRDKLGEGGMGTVWAADQREPVVRRVALKLIKRGMDSAEVVARFEAERQALARMTHPNVAQVYDGGTAPDGRPYFAMELVEGEPVHAYCDRHRLTTRARLELFLDVCRGVQHAHVRGLIHRDLKPSNVLVTEQDGRPVPKIIDFGVARATTGRLAEHSLHTLVGQLIGTLDYMSPEQADPTGAGLDIRSDVYSLGVVLYQLLSGLLPFAHLDEHTPWSERQRAIREVDPPMPSTGLRQRAVQIAPLHGTDARTLVRQLAGDLDWICMKALEKDPARRYQSAAELADDVRRHLADEPVLAGRPGVLYRAQKFVRRHRVGVAAAVLVAAALLGGGYVAVAGRLEAQAQLPYVHLHQLRQLVQRADSDDLWPLPLRDLAALQRWITDLEGWQEKAGELARAQAVHQADHAAIRARPARSLQDSARHDALVELLAGLDALVDEKSGLLGNESAVSPAHGWSVPRRLAVARDLATGFAPGGRYARAWDEVLERIRETYGLPGLTPQIGLVPIGRDPDSGSKYWLFADLLSGKPPVPDATGKVVMAAETGVVLILLPGGRFTIGAQWEDPGAANYDPGSEPQGPTQPKFENPPVEVEVPPFFLSKFELTQAQWERGTGKNPSLQMASANLFHVPTNPVNQVDWEPCKDVLRRYGLVLPHEEQWEYAARGGSQTPATPWWTGLDPAAVTQAENLLGAADGHFTIAPVGSFRPNPFGLFDMLGNVSEWCGNRPYRYGESQESAPQTELEHVARGGCARSTPPEARVSMRLTAQRMTHPALGLRPARVLVD